MGQYIGGESEPVAWQQEVDSKLVGLGLLLSPIWSCCIFFFLNCIPKGQLCCGADNHLKVDTEGISRKLSVRDQVLVTKMDK